MITGINNNLCEESCKQPGLSQISLAILGEFVNNCN